MHRFYSGQQYTPHSWSKFKFQYSILVQIPAVHARMVMEQNNNHCFSGKTDADGQHQEFIEFKETARKVKPVTITCEASVQDINRQAINSSASSIIHPSSLYVGVNQEAICEAQCEL